MLFGPSHLRSYEGNFGYIVSTTHVDPDGTCRIYYGSPDLANGWSTFGSIFRSDKVTEIRNLEFHYHMQPDIVHDRTMFPITPSMAVFKRACPFWFFADAADNTPKPKCTIVVTYHGKGELPHSYDEMLNLLLGLMEAMTLSGFDDVVVKVVPGKRGSGSQCLPLPEMSMALLRHHFETYMGTASVVDAGEECYLQFRPRQLAATWSEQRRAGAPPRGLRRSARLAVRNALKRVS